MGIKLAQDKTKPFESVDPVEDEGAASKGYVGVDDAYKNGATRAYQPIEADTSITAEEYYSKDGQAKAKAPADETKVEDEKSAAETKAPTAPTAKK